MSLTRREFAMATASGLSLFSFSATAHIAHPISPTAALRHAHLELPAGPYTRASLSHLISRAADAIGLPAPDSATALGTSLSADLFPLAFALSCVYHSGLRFNVRASTLHGGTPELTLRGEVADLTLHFSTAHDAFRVSSPLS